MQLTISRGEGFIGRFPVQIIFGEILQWFGFALASWSLAGLAFALYTAANLVPRALASHAWYRQQFQEYPESRKAVIPFLL